MWILEFLRIEVRFKKKWDLGELFKDVGFKFKQINKWIKW